ncbi:MAG: glycosyltransferase family 4 protein [Cyanophyceae cyanobacterium]
MRGPSTISHPPLTKVVVYTDSAGIGGAEISLGHLVAFVSPEIELTVLGTSEKVVEAIAARRPQANRIVLPERGLGGLVAHWQALSPLKPDVVHVNLCAPWAGMTGLTAALMLPHSRVVRVDQLPLRTTELRTWLPTRWLCLRVDAHVSVGQTSAKLMEDFYALGRGAVLSVPNGVPDLGAAPLPCHRDQLVIGSIGRLDPMKAHDVLLRAIAQMQEVRAVILGEGAYRQKLEQLACELGVSDRVELRGWVETPREVLPQFDVVVQPSRSEGFPLTVVEAMLAARPVIATRVGSMAEAVVDGETGILIDKNDVDGLVAALRRLHSPELRQRFGQRGRVIAAASLTAQQMAAQIEQIWQTVVSQPQRPRLFVPRPRD